MRASSHLIIMSHCSMTALLLAILISILMQVDGFPWPIRFKAASNQELTDLPVADDKPPFDEISSFANGLNNNNLLKHEKEKLSIPPLTTG